MTDDIALCRRRVLKLERLIRRLLVTYDTSEMSNYQLALEALRKAMQQI